VAAGSVAGPAPSPRLGTSAAGCAARARVARAVAGRGPRGSRWPPRWEARGATPRRPGAPGRGRRGAAGRDGDRRAGGRPGRGRETASAACGRSGARRRRHGRGRRSSRRAGHAPRAFVARGRGRAWAWRRSPRRDTVSVTSPRIIESAIGGTTYCRDQGGTTYCPVTKSVPYKKGLRRRRDTDSMHRPASLESAASPRLELVRNMRGRGPGPRARSERAPAS
jgi:hypothetical protein